MVPCRPVVEGQAQQHHGDPHHKGEEHRKNGIGGKAQWDFIVFKYNENQVEVAKKISEELGFLGCLIIITLFVIICYNGFKISRNCNDLFGKYLAFGIIFQIAFQACLNLMVVVGLIPVTGYTRKWEKIV